MKKKQEIFAYAFVSNALAAVLYILFHEMGHLIVMLAAGATIVEFSIITAHVSGTGGAYTDLSVLWLHTNGALLPILVSYIYMLFYESDSEKPLYCFFLIWLCLCQLYRRLRGLLFHSCIWMETPQLVTM